MFGDSLDGSGLPVGVTPNEPVALQALLQKQFKDSGITVQNNATGGLASSLMNELDGMDGGGPPTPQRLAESPASIVIEEHAVNDALGGETLSDYQGYLAQWILDARAAGKTPILEEPGPVCDGQHPLLPQYVAAIDAAAQQYGVVLIQQYNYISSIQGWQSHMANCFYPDAYLDGLRAAQEQLVIAPIISASFAQ